MNIILAIICTAVILSTMAISSMAAKYRAGEKLYVIGSVVNVRKRPSTDAPISGKLPIGTKVTYLGIPSTLGPNSSKSECLIKDYKPDETKNWICVRIPWYSFGSSYGYWGGWIVGNLLDRKPLKLADLIARYDQTPKKNLALRRKWSERAAALNPLSKQAQKRLLNVLSKIPDPAALASAKRSFGAYQARRVSTPRHNQKLIFAFTRGFIEPIAELKARRVIFRGIKQQVNHNFRSRGHFYNLYSRGRKIGAVATETEFDCTVKKCPSGTLVRTILDRKTARATTGIVTNFNLPQTDKATSTLTQIQRIRLLQMAKAWTKSSKLRPKAKQVFLRHIQQGGAGNTLTVGQLSKDGKVVLIGNWVMGSMNDSHYGGPDDIYMPLLIIAEQQQDGTFKLSPGSGHMPGDGCSYFDHADFDGDGTVEVLLLCEQLEGQYNYSLLKRIKGKWKISNKGPFR